MNLLPIGYMELESIYARTVGEGMRTLAVTSSVSGEGVTTVAEALAKRVEAAGNRALLVELNLFRPELTRRFGVARQNWLPMDSEHKDSAIRVDGFSLLSAPSSPDAALRFREHAALQTAIERWLSDYDVVVFDTSPLNAVNQGNIPAELVCTACDGSLMVVQAGCTSESSVREAAQRLRDAGANLLGSVVNDRFNPTLPSELIRETFKVNRYFPRFSAWVRSRIRASALLNAGV